MRGTVFHPDFGGSITFESEPLPADADSSVANTIRKMTQYAVADSNSPIVLNAVMDAAPADGFTPVTLLEDLHAWIRRHVRFVEDDELAEGARFGKGNEILVRPVDLLRMPAPSEDCDGFSMLAAAMIECAARVFSIPYRVNFVTVGADAFHPDEFSHVYCYVSLRGKVVPFDASHGAYVGWETPNRFGKRAVWPVGDFMLAVRNPSFGLGRYRYNRRVSGLGQDSTTIDPGIVAAADQTIVETSYPGLAPASPGINWNAILPGLFSAGEQVVKQVTLPSGAYTVTTPQGQVMASNVPGAVPGGLSLSPAVAGGGLGTLVLLGGGALLLMFALSRR